jgi:hypothetical protein
MSTLPHDPPNVLVVSHRRSGTHLVIDTIENNFPAYRRRRRPRTGLNLDHLTSRGLRPLTLGELSIHVAGGPVVLKSHAHADLERFFGAHLPTIRLVQELFASCKVIYVHRDGRDVMVSLYHYLRTYDPGRAPADFGGFLRAENHFDTRTYDGTLNRAEYWSHHVRGWLHRPQILYLAYERLIRRYEEAVLDLADFLGAEPARRIRKVVRSVAFDHPWVHRAYDAAHRALAWRVRGTHHSSVAFRRGRVGDYRELFDTSALEYFEGVAADVLDELGYARSSLRGDQAEPCPS